MRWEQRVCDLCGRRSALELVAEPPRRVSSLTPPRSMLERGWTILGGEDRCPDCTWVDDPEEKGA